MISTERVLLGRLKTEMDEVSVKISRLKKFIAEGYVDPESVYATLPEVERTLLIDQLAAMSEYLRIIEFRHDLISLRSAL
jgi:hypothetical protein